MPNLLLFGCALGLLAAGSGMAFYEWARIKAGTPLLEGRNVLTLYWVTYLSLIVLGLTAGVAAAIK